MTSMNFHNEYDTYDIKFVSSKDINFVLLNAYNDILNLIKVGEDKFNKELEEVHEQNDSVKKYADDLCQKLNTERSNHENAVQEKESISNELLKLKKQHRSLQLAIIDKAQKISQLQTKIRTKKLSIDRYSYSSGYKSNDGIQPMPEDIKQHFIDIYDSQLECLICNETFVFVTATNCGHLFCEDCIETWNYGTQTCPVCRSDIMCLTAVKGMDNIIEKLTETFKPLKFQQERLELIKKRKGKAKEKKRLWYHEKTPNVTEVAADGDADDIDTNSVYYSNSESEQSDLEDGEWDEDNNQRRGNYDNEPYYSPGYRNDSDRARFGSRSPEYLPSPPLYGPISPPTPSPSYSPQQFPQSPPYFANAGSAGTSPDYNVFSPATRGPGSPQPYSPQSPMYSPSSPISPLPYHPTSPPYSPYRNNERPEYAITTSRYNHVQTSYLYGNENITRF